jgi:D-sedoheptulose 7-phosphate isomerase
MNASKYLKSCVEVLEALDVKAIDRAIEQIELTWKAGNKIITMGNGGSALTASHFINDWNKSIFMSTGRQFKGYSLTDNIGLIMSYANDVSYSDIFTEQLKNVANPGDIVIAISGSGNSENIIRAVNYCNMNNLNTIGLCGYDGGKLKALVRHPVWVNRNDMQLSEDVHFMFGHIVMQTLCRG